jgi:hypothetical protein
MIVCAEGLCLCNGEGVEYYTVRERSELLLSMRSRGGSFRNQPL